MKERGSFLIILSPIVILSLKQKYDVISFHTGLPLLPLYNEAKYTKIRIGLVLGRALKTILEEARCLDVLASGFFFTMKRNMVS